MQKFTAIPGTAHILWKHSSTNSSIAVCLTQQTRSPVVLSLLRRDCTVSTIGVPREIWTLELVQSVGLQLYSLGAYFEAEKVFRCHLDYLRGMIQFPRHHRLLWAECWVTNALYYQEIGKESKAINKRL